MLQLWQDLLQIMGWAGPSFYSQIHDAAYIVVKLLKYILWEFLDNIHITSKCMHEKIFIKYIPKIAAKISNCSEKGKM